MANVYEAGSGGDITVEVNGGSHTKLTNLTVVDANVEARSGSQTGWA
jgi:hypothetical protein